MSFTRFYGSRRRRPYRSHVRPVQEMEYDQEEEDRLGSTTGPPPIANKRSPDRERRSSPGYDREAEWRRFQEWEKRNRKSPPRISPVRSPGRGDRRPPSPRKDRSPPRADWGRRSPPRSYRPPEWGRRSRSPPRWNRRSPPHYGPPRWHSPPRGRSPPRWGPPHPEWSRQRGGYPPRRSPPRYGPPPRWGDSRGGRYAPSRPGDRWQPPPSNKSVARPNGGPAPVPSIARPSPESVKMDEPTADEDDFENYELPEYDAEVPQGQKYVIAVSGFFCKICHKFYNSESSAKVTHCRSKAHYEKFAKWVSDKKEEAVARKRAAPSEAATPANPGPVPAPEQDSLEPPLKVPKMEHLEEAAPRTDDQEDDDSALMIKEELKDDSDQEQVGNRYDPSDPTTEEPSDTTPMDEVISSACESFSEMEKANISGTEDFLEATLSNFRKMRVQQLKDNLKKRDLPLTGLKPLLLKRLERALLAEAAEAVTAENEEEPSQEQQDVPVKAEFVEENVVKEEAPQAEEPTQESKAEEEEGEPVEPTPVKLLRLTMHESDIEVSNKKSQWITERELRRELLQLPGIDEVFAIEKQESKMGKKTVVEWTISLNYSGEFPEEGLNFWLGSHQELPFRAALAEEEEEE